MNRYEVVLANGTKEYVNAETWRASNGILRFTVKGYVGQEDVKIYSLANVISYKKMSF